MGKMKYFLDLTGLTTYDRMLKEWFKTNVVEIAADAIRALFAIPAKGPANNEIWYTSTDGNVVTPHTANRYRTDPFGVNIVSNTYENGKGIITFDGDVKSIGIYAFRDCISLTSVTLPNSVTCIGSYAFSYCTSLTSITIPNNVQSIGEDTFSWCSSLTSITIPNSVQSIGNSAFNGCTGLASVTIPNSITNIRDDMFYGCYGLTSITIPNSVQSIGNSAFNGCTGLASITIPNSVTSIEYEAFSCCTNLKYIKYNGCRKDWYEIRLGNKWNENIPCKIVQCLDGDLYLNEYIYTIGIFDNIK
jgi:hypothetical protein